MSNTTSNFGQLMPVILDMAHLQKAGVLMNPGRSFELDVGIRVIAKRREDVLHFRVQKFGDEIFSLFPADNGHLWNTFEVQLVYRELNYGSRPYFVCPHTGLDCLKLIFSNGVVCSKAAFGKVSAGVLEFMEASRRLLKQDGTERISPLEQQRLVALVKKNPSRYRSENALPQLVKRHDQMQARKEHKFHWESRDLSTTKGLDNGRGIFGSLVYDGYLARSPSWIESIPAYVLRNAAAQDEIQNFPELDIKVLLNRIDFEQESVTGRTLGWPSGAGGIRAVEMFVDPRSGNLPQIVFGLRSAMSDERTWQVIHLLPGPSSPKARYFLCPVSHARCEVLYLRNGGFASAPVHRLRKPKNWRPAIV